MTKQEDKLREIVYRNWKNGDEVGLYEEVKKLHLQEIELIREMIEELDLSCVDDRLLGKTDEYLNGYNTSTERWREKRDDILLAITDEK
jgi:hypothetical protein